MSQSVRRRETGWEQGFSLLEVLVAMTVLVIGMMSTAMLMANVYKYTVRSRYMGLATQLASEELEDLGRWPASSSFTDPHISVPAGSNTCGITGETCIGSLTADIGPQTFTDSSGINTYVSYYDTVSLSTDNGVMSEIYKMPCTGGNWVLVPFSPNGITPLPTCLSTAPNVGMTFDRRWVIEMNQPVVGVRRITVLVTLEDLSVQLYTKLLAGQQPPPSVTFQMSMVRP
jgi:prepilin-type N-terminal cleavage/methylation domain-containing protein